MRWMYAVDPAYEGAEQIPPYAIAGAYPVGEDGSPAEEMIPNPDYRPSPRALGWPAPANEIEAAVQNAATGHGDDAAVRDALLAGQVFVDPAASSSDELHAWTSDRYLPSAGDWRLLPASSLAGRVVTLNPGTDLEVRLPAAALV
ncbi:MULTISPECIES: type VII secretion system-associated protein [Actinoplanes]|uniref:type VII secretion system-associated protein n=1 Tax=Actinoplanes TaxID=1865 RepID=UPI000AE7BE3E|nr:MULTISPECIES: type VII secretion system-associated protein [Actinoplanes]GLY04414.1 hypothetical protein Acsp01_47930 [Actinoplanes sp. NBRC 101535]